MKHIITIIKKELVRVFRDRRLVFMIFLFPALMLYLMYSLMGDFMYKQPEVYNIEAKYLPAEVQVLIENNIPNVNITINNDSIEDSKLKLKENIIDLVIIFDDNFLSDLSTISNVKILYNPGSTASTTAYQLINSVLDIYKKAIQSQVYGENFEMFNIESITSSSEEETAGQMYALILPFLIITFLFSGVTAVAPESIAGEKERGTITTLLVTPIKRAHIALGKIGALSLLAVLSAISSFVGLIISLPKLMGDASSGMENIYNINDYMMVFSVLIVTSLILVSLVSIMSCFAKNTKEASMYSMPLMIISMAISMTSMLGIKTNNNLLFAIPLFNSIQLLSQIFTFDVNLIHFIITIIINLLFTSILIYILTKMFDNEKIMFSK